MPRGGGRTCDGHPQRANARACEGTTLRDGSVEHRGSGRIDGYADALCVLGIWEHQVLKVTQNQDLPVSKRLLAFL